MQQDTIPEGVYQLLPGWPELTIRDNHAEVDIVIWQIKWGGEWQCCWMINDDGDCYDSGYQFDTHGHALDDALEFIVDVISGP